MKVLGQQIQSLPKTPTEVDLMLVAGTTAGLAGFLILLGTTQTGVAKVAAWGAAGIFAASGIGAAIELCTEPAVPPVVVTKETPPA